MPVCSLILLSCFCLWPASAPSTVPCPPRGLWGIGCAGGRRRGLQATSQDRVHTSYPNLPLRPCFLEGCWRELERSLKVKTEHSGGKVVTTSRRAHGLLSPVAGQQRRPWNDRTNGSSWASCKFHGVRGSLHLPLATTRNTVRTEYPARASGSAG